MPARLRISIVLVAMLAAGSLPSLVHASSPPPTSSLARASSSPTPTPAQIRTAVRRAERSRDLWATVNICNTKRHPNVIGVRGQMPGLGFPATLEVDIQVDYWSPASKGFRSAPGAKRSIPLGREKTGLYQGGWQFPFGPHAGSLRGLVTFKWKLGSKQLGRATRTTSAGHRDAEFGDPARYSSGNCVIR
jgi:hypothetical protein